MKTDYYNPGEREICANCGKSFNWKTIRKQFCSDECFKEYYNKIYNNVSGGNQDGQ